MLIRAATWQASYRNASTVEGMVASLSQGLEAIAVSAVGKQTISTIYTALSLNLPAGSILDTPFGALRSRRQGDELVIGQFRNGNHLPEGLAVLETPRLQILRVLPGEGQLEEQLPGLEANEAVLVSLAALLAQEDEWRRPCEPVLATRLTPVLPGIGGGAARDRVIEGPYLDTDGMARLQHWTTCLSACSLSDISTHRILSMMRRNAEHVDAFIDAVIVWENLFGLGDSQELSYRVSVNMAFVLADHPAERVALQREIKLLYNLRSRVVHGGEHLDGLKAHNTRLRAHELTLASLRKLLNSYPSLLGAKPDAFTALILGGTRL
ncbi:MAG: hypothetical protein HOP28_14675 [Gemmatimonadales bacterium]|nr:hypothetical protein [Gemmatimonadales bacterium]